MPAPIRQTLYKITFFEYAGEPVPPRSGDERASPVWREGASKATKELQHVALGGGDATKLSGHAGGFASLNRVKSAQACCATPISEVFLRQKGLLFVCSNLG